MTVHLLRAPDYDPDDYFAVCSLLKTLDLPGWHFIVPEVEIDPEEFDPNWGGGRRRPEEVRFRYHSPVHKIMYCYGRHAPLSWRELFAVCQHYRTNHRIDPSHEIVLLTKRPNALNWFSAFDGNGNIFIHTADWERYVSADAKYPIAYQVLSNTLQQSMGLDKDASLIHQEPIGCMNDFCGHKQQVSLKLRTGDICTECLNRLQQAEVPDLLVESALSGFEQLRRQMLFRQGFRRSVGPLVVNRHGKLLFPQQGNLEVSMPALSRTLYLFFLQHREGVRFTDLGDNTHELHRLYGRISGSGSPEQMQASVQRLVNPLENSFNENLSRIRKSFNDTLGASIAAPYQIVREPDERYRVHLERFPLQWELDW
ncbi:hypothetical protein F5984_23295 [Rudanella paleaurantiibacter]|uniref:Uncharacterized protein n=1 Tax=Rudanella paleaurantiibacter TaxID=2614655 RepID=A0A7J5TT80_9BACT|nr:hypothetical protein [Rudanella paleaurantiibacter]KAB7726843.1 hypothetical protein F5984_23295 [Rudanella paleaurantiibacter]